MLENIGTKMWFSPKKNSYEKYKSTRPNPPRNPINLTWPASLPCLLSNIWNVEYIWYGIYKYEFRFVKILKNRYKSEKRKKKLYILFIPKINCTYCYITDLNEKFKIQRIYQRCPLFLISSIILYMFKERIGFNQTTLKGFSDPFPSLFCVCVCLFLKRKNG